MCYNRSVKSARTSNRQEMQMISYYLSAVETDEDRDKIIYIYENFYSFMAYTAGQILCDSNAVEDIVHNAMIKIIENIDMIDFSDLRKTKNLCGIVAKNKARDHLKRKDNQVETAEEWFESDDGEENEPESIMIHEEAYRAILEEIRSMSDIYRDVCLLKYVSELREREIARLLDISEGTVATRIRRGRKILKEKLRKDGFYE